MTREWYTARAAVDGLLKSPLGPSVGPYVRQVLGSQNSLELQGFGNCYGSTRDASLGLGLIGLPWVLFLAGAILTQPLYKFAAGPVVPAGVNGANHAWLLA